MLSARQVEFLSQDEEVEVMPTAPMDAMACVGGTWGPFVPMRPTTVPLWLACLLKRKGKCRIKPPAWLDKDFLASAYESEKSDRAHFYAMPSFHFLPVAYQLFAVAPDDIRDLEQVRAALEDLRAVRAKKVRDGIVGVKPGSGDEMLFVTNLSSVEINTSRRFLCGSMARLRVVTQATTRISDAAAAAENAQLADTSSFPAPAPSQEQQQQQQQMPRRVLRANRTLL